jgi:hypothetical protein
MNAPALTSSPAPGDRRPAAGLRSRGCLAAGAVLLAAGCALGAALPADRAWSLALLCGSVVLFAIAGVLEFRQRPVAAADKGADFSTATRPLIATPGALPRPAPNGSPGPLPARSVGTALAVMAPPAAAPSPSPSPPPPPMALPLKNAPVAQPIEAALGLPALMRLPLSDLLLAALCKDPQGARAIFAQALQQPDPGVAPAALPHNPAVAQPAAEPG